MKQRKCRFLHSWIIHLKQRNFLGIRYYPALFKISTVLIIICTVYPIITFCLTKEGTAGTFGDQYGFINALISGMAFAAFWCSLQLQHRELKLQRKELSRANKEAKDQTKQFEAQTKQFEKQIEITQQNQIKDAFYRRLSFLKQLESDITYKWVETLHNSVVPKIMQVSGISAAERYFQNIVDRPQYMENENWLKSHPCTCEAFRVWMRFFFTLVDDLMNHYQDEENRRFYIRILINSTSLHERALVYYDYKNLKSKSVNKTMEYLLKKEFINPDLFHNITHD